MNWTKIDKNNLPDDEVLAINRNEGTYGFGEVLVGYIGETNGGYLICENDNEVLENPSHYISVDDLNKSLKEQLNKIL